MNLLTAVVKFLSDEEGATMVEYGVMVALISVVCIATVTSIGTNLNGIFAVIDSRLQPLTP